MKKLRLFLSKIKYETKVNILFFLILYISMILWQPVFIIGLLLHALFFIIYVFLSINNNYYTNLSRLYYIHQFGAKRRGKDLSFQLSIYKRFSKKYKKFVRKNNIEPIFYLSNVDYGYGAKVIDLNDLKLVDLKTNHVLTHNDIITGAYRDMTFEKKHDYEGLDLYISDAQLGLPNTEHNSLDKLYPWLAPFIALAGQLYNMNIHINTQEYNRLWIKLRGQQDMYVKSLKTFPMNKSSLSKVWKNIPILNNFIFFKVRIYDNATSAEQNILPYKAMSLINETTKHAYLTSGQSIKEQYNATHGLIREKTLFINRKNIRYDSRIFHAYIWGYAFREEGAPSSTDNH